MSLQYNAVCCKSFICFVGYTVASDFKTIKLVFGTMCFPEMDCATGCTPLLNTKTLLDNVALMRGCHTPYSEAIVGCHCCKCIPTFHHAQGCR